MMIDTDLCQDHVYEERVSSVTGRSILVNTDQNRFLVPPTWCPQALAGGVADIKAKWAAFSPDLRPMVALRPVILAPFQAEHRTEYVAAVETLYRAIRGLYGRSAGARIADAFCHLWRLGGLLFPGVRDAFPLRPIRDDQLGAAGAIARIYQQALDVPEDHERLLVRAMRLVLLRRSGVLDLGDLSPNVVTGNELMGRMTGRSLKAMHTLVRLQQQEHGVAAVRHVANSYGPFRAIGQKRRGDFRWILEKDPSLEQWRALGERWLAQVPHNKEQHCSTVNGFLEYLALHHHLPRDPFVYLSKTTTIEPLFDKSDTIDHNDAFEFLDFILRTECAEVGEDGGVYIAPTFRNPMTRKVKRHRPDQTGREAMPTRYVRMLLDILTEDDWAWVKALSASSNGIGDWMMVVDPQTNKETQVWSPTRAYAIFIKLRMPFRTFQIRMLDSGEGDAETWLADIGWTRNLNPLAAPAAKPVQRGVLQRTIDARTRREHLVLRVNTNKTADQDKDQVDMGYDCPWAPDDVVAALTALRDWQVRWNPINTPTKWEAVQELVKKKTPRQLAGKETCFLFRDAGNKDPRAPVSDGRLRTLWLRLMTELEDRLWSLGERLPNGDRMALVERNATGVPTVSAYDLHSLRVTLITAFAEQGVPPEILMKIVGHATVIMTVYYTKFGISHISEVMNEAAVAIHREEQRNWAKWLADRRYKQLEQAVAWNDRSGLNAIENRDGKSWVVRDIGICPVGCGRCHEGGAKMSGSQSLADYAPVPGGASNCVQCRFFITGPAFLVGLVAHGNTLLQALKEKSGKRSEVERIYENLNFLRRQCERDSRPFTKLQEWERASSAYDQYTEQVDRLALSLNATVRLINQSQAILARGPGDADSFALIIADLHTVEVALEETSDFELADAVCQSAAFYEAVDATTANLKRLRQFDSMLRRNGLDTVFLDLDEATALRAGNELTKFLVARVGRKGALDLMEGRETLRRLGVDVGDMEMAIATVAPARIASRRAGQPIIHDVLPAC